MNNTAPLRVTLWQQFSSNHSGSFRVVGIFDTPAEAEKAAMEVRGLLTEIEQWAMEHWDDDELWELEFISPPEAAYREAHHLPPQGVSFYAPETYHPTANEAVTTWDRLLFIQSEYTIHPAYDLPLLVEHLGGQAAWDDIAMGATVVLLTTLTCRAPDEPTALAIYEKYKAELEPTTTNYSDSQAERLATIHERGMVGKAEREELLLTFRLIFANIDEALPALVRYLEEQGSTEIVYEIEEKRCGEELGLLE